MWLNEQESEIIAVNLEEVLEAGCKEKVGAVLEALGEGHFLGGGARP